MRKKAKTKKLKQKCEVGGDSGVVDDYQKLHWFDLKTLKEVI